MDSHLADHQRKPEDPSGEPPPQLPDLPPGTFGDCQLARDGPTVASPAPAPAPAPAGTDTGTEPDARRTSKRDVFTKRRINTIPMHLTGHPFPLDTVVIARQSRHSQSWDEALVASFKVTRGYTLYSLTWKKATRTAPGRGTSRNLASRSSHHRVHPLPSPVNILTTSLGQPPEQTPLIPSRPTRASSPNTPDSHARGTKQRSSLTVFHAD